MSAPRRRRGRTAVAGRVALHRLLALALGLALGLGLALVPAMVPATDTRSTTGASAATLVSLPADAPDVGMGAAEPAADEPVADEPVADALDRVEPDADVLARVDDYLARSRAEQGWPALTAALVSGGKVVWSAGYGVSGPDDGPVTAETPFLIASLSKSVTALAAMRLVDSGAVALDEPVTAHLPELAPRGDGLTVTDLMFQRTGITGWSDNDAMTGAPTDSLATVVGRLEPLLRPGADFEYSNGNYDALALLVERASGRPFEDYLQDEVFGPLRMSHASTIPELARAAGLADGHYHWLLAGNRPHTPPLPDGTVGSYRMFASAEDLAHLLVMHVGAGAYADEQVLQPQSLTLLQTGEPVGQDSEASYGGGLYVHPAESHWMTGASAAYRFLEHDGSALTHRSYLWLMPELGLGFVVLVNANNWSDESALPQVGFNVRQIVLDEQVTPVTSQSDPLRRWAKHLFATLALVQLALILAAAQTLRRTQRGRPIGRLGTAALVAAVVVNLVVLYALLRLIPSVVGAPLRAVVMAPDARLVIAAMVLGLVAGLGLAIASLLRWATVGRRPRSHSAPAPDPS